MAKRKVMVKDLQVGDVIVTALGHEAVVNQIEVGTGKYDTTLSLGFDDGIESECGYNASEFVEIPTIF